MLMENENRIQGKQIQEYNLGKRSTPDTQNKLVCLDDQTMPLNVNIDVTVFTNFKQFSRFFTSIGMSDEKDG